MFSLITKIYLGLMAFYLSLLPLNEQFGVYAINDSNDFEVIDYVLRGNTYSNNTKDTLDIQYYSLFLKPGKSEQVGIGSYQIEPSNQNPLKLVTASDSSKTHVKVRNKSRNARLLVIGLTAGITTDTTNFQIVEVRGGETKTIYLPSLVHTFDSPMIDKKNLPFPGLTLKVKQAHFEKNNPH